MVTGVKMEKQSILYNKVVYIAIPKRLFEAPITIRALRYVKTLKPLATIDPRGMFNTNEEWAKQFPRYLKPCDACVIVSDDGYVGKGVYEEWLYFQKCNLPTYFYHDLTSSLALAKDIHIADENDWKNYGTVIYG